MLLQTGSSRQQSNHTRLASPGIFPLLLDRIATPGHRLFKTILSSCICNIIKLTPSYLVVNLGVTNGVRTRDYAFTGRYVTTTLWSPWRTSNVQWSIGESNPFFRIASAESTPRGCPIWFSALRVSSQFRRLSLRDLYGNRTHQIPLDRRFSFPAES